MATCDRCKATLSLYEYNLVEDAILCDNCAKNRPLNPLPKIESHTIAGYQLFEEYDSENSLRSDEKILKDNQIDVQIQSRDRFTSGALSKKRKTIFYLYVPTDKLTAANALLRYKSEEGGAVLLRNAPHQLWIRRAIYVVMVVSLPVIYKEPGIYLLLFGFASLALALTKDLSWRVTYLCSNSKCRVQNRKNAHFCTHCGAHFETVEHREHLVEKFKRRVWK